VQCEVPVPVLVETARLCDLGATRLVVNCAPATELPAAVLTRADPLVVNQSEAAQLLSRSAPVPAAEAEPAARSLLALGCRSVVITLGADGAVVAQRDGVAVRLGSPVVDVVDTTGAGDAFVAALASAFLHGSGLDEAAAIAVEAGAIAVTRRGARAGFPSSADLNRPVSPRG
jgi:ribokinase